MRVLRFLLVKEFKQIFRNRIILAMVSLVPVVQLIILPFAADFEIKHLRIAVVDLDHSPSSRLLLSRVTASGYFREIARENAYRAAEALVANRQADLVVEIPPHFERDLIREQEADVFIAADAINGTNAGLGTSYLTSIIRGFNEDVRLRLGGVSTGEGQILTTASNWYNPHLNYKLLMVPGILAMLVTLIGGFLSALNVVREKEAGTMEQINVTPIKKGYFILGKLLPFWVLGQVVFTLGLATARIVYGIVPVGSVLLLYGFVALYLMGVLGFGLLVSTFCQTQQQAMLIMFFFIMVFILMSGLFTPVDVMPGWARVVVACNPLSYLIEVMRMVILKGSRLAEMLPDLGMMVVFALVLNGLAILNYRKTA